MGHPLKTSEINFSSLSSSMPVSVKEPKLSSLCKTKSNPGRKKMVSKYEEVEVDDPSGQKSETRVSTFNLYFSFLIGVLLLLFRHQIVDPAFIFAIYPSMFHAPVISVMLSFVGASFSLLVGILLPQHAAIPRCSLRISSVSLASTVLIMTFALVLEIFRLVSSGMKSGQLNEDGGDSFFVYSYVFQVYRKIYPGSEQLSLVT